MGGHSANANYTRTVLKFDSASSVWSAVAPMPEEQTSAAVCAIGTSIFVAGGLSDSWKDTLFKYDTEANEWSTLAAMPATTRCPG